MDNKSTNYKFTDESSNCYEGSSAKKLIELLGDKKYLTNEGICKIDKERWDIAQCYEKSEWMSRNLILKDDRNYFHKDIFEDYGCLDGVDVESIIELGCGPFTNARLILEKFPNIEEVTLLDPLATDYLNHPNCRYKNSKLSMESRNSNPSVKLISNSIEDSNILQTFDMVVMINVLEHCFDIPKIFKTIDKILNKNGILIYADVQFDLDVVETMAKFKYNAGHPIRVTKSYINNILNSKYKPLFSKTFEEEVSGLKGEERYFIGKKLE